jgi:hypothetical protein
MLMLVQWGILVHQLRTSNKLLARDSALLGLTRGRVAAVFVLAMCRPRVHQLVQEEDHAQLSTLYRGLHRHLPLVRLPPLAPGEAY